MIIVGERLVFDLLTIGVLTFIFIFIQIGFYLFLVRQLKPFATLVSKAFGMAGKRSGEVRADSAVKDDLMNQVLNSPKMTALKVGADFLGVDLDASFEKHGPEKTIQGLLEIAGMLGINPMEILQGGLGGSPQGLLGPQGQGNQVNPFLRMRR